MLLWAARTTASSTSERTSEQRHRVACMQLCDTCCRYEESLFKCEDDRYELDMVIECNSSTLRTLQPLLDRINKLPVHERSKFRMPKTLKTIHAHAIELVCVQPPVFPRPKIVTLWFRYADHGADVVDYIHRAPATALPVVIPRLQVRVCVCVCWCVLVRVCVTFARAGEGGGVARRAS